SADSASCTGWGRGARIQAADVTGANRGVPGAVDVAAVVGGNRVVLAVVEQDVGVGLAAHRAVKIVDRQRAPCTAAAVVVVEAPVVFREMYGFRIHEGQTPGGV